LSTDQANVTGDGTIYTLIADNELVDNGGNYDNTTGVFTAPVTGLYAFNCGFDFSGLLVANTVSTIRLQTTPRTWLAGLQNPGVTQTSGNLEIAGSWIVPLTVGDTAYVETAISGGALVVDIRGDFGGPTSSRTWFSGYLIR
jgi:hypothetical protein